MPRTARRPSTPILTDIDAPRDPGDEVIFDTAFVARTLDRLIAGRLHDLDTLRRIAVELNTAENATLHRQLLALARSARDAFGDLQQSREILVGLHKQASGGQVIASVDSPSTLPNRTAFSTHLSEVLKQLAPARTLSLMLVEIGALQVLAHEVGPAVANRVVKRFSAILRRTVKRTDYVARIGPQHFVVMFEDILPEKVVGIALRVHEAIEARMSSKGGAVAGLLSVTMGIATAAGPGQSADDLLHKAHDAVAQARKEGRPAIYVA